MSNGKIGVTTENIFPIIKKFLYSDHEIFLREVVSNAVDATQKLKTMASVGEFKGELGDLTIRIALDEKAKTITISDSGIGMTEEEIEKYINQIAFSGAEEFMAKYKNAENGIIGHFGLGFYSAFMVSKKVEIVTHSYKDGAAALRWSCDGSPDYTIEPAEREARGTDIILHIDDESSEFAEKSRIEGLLKKYCRYLPIPIAFGKEQDWKDGKYVDTDKDNVINNPNPIWTRKPADLKEEDYMEFYHELYPMAEDPLFSIHLNVDYPFNLTGVLYFPKLKNNLEVQKNRIQLYCRQVFVTDNVEGIVPEFLTLLHGVLDSPDIPLNVSRSYLQSDSNVKKISSHITKKVADRLQEIFKSDRPQFESKWDDLKIFIEYGMLTDEKFYERAEKFFLFKNSDGKYFTIEEYEKLIKPNQEDKDKKLVYLYTTNREQQFTYIEKAQNKGYDVLIMDGQLDAHFVNHLESKLKDARFVRVDSDVVDRLIPKEDLAETKLSLEQQEELRPVFLCHAPENTNFTVMFENLAETDAPVLITQSEFMRRMKDMAQMGGGGMNFYGELPDSYNLVVNANHPLVSKVIGETETKMKADLEKVNGEIAPVEASLKELQNAQKDLKHEEIPQADKDKVADVEKQLNALKDRKKAMLTEFGKKNKLAKQLVDLALLANNMLKGEALAKFVVRSVEMIKK
ncbi:MAG TPA: molecular chaperone HtpG [Williamwhitmania sp.]|nr:molecular chaperone HtpG [Williamwhitmania sp.]